MAQMKEQIKTPEKELNKIEISNLSDAEFKTLVIRMLRELSEDLSSIKKIQSETKVTQIKITIYRETTVKWMKARIKSMIWNIRKQKTTNQNNKKKKESKKNEDSVSSLLDNFKHSTFISYGYQRRRERARNWKCI